MNKNGAIVIIEDDIDDQFILKEVFRILNYPNETVWFDNGEAALNYLKNGNINPFLILSDINLPKLSGIELRTRLRLNADLNLKCIPYLFFTTAANEKTVIEAYSASVQGFFTKPDTFEALTEQIRIIMEYWKHCSAPNNFL